MHHVVEKKAKITCRKMTDFRGVESGKKATCHAGWYLHVFALIFRWFSDLSNEKINRRRRQVKISVLLAKSRFFFKNRKKFFLSAR